MVEVILSLSQRAVYTAHFSTKARDHTTCCLKGHTSIIHSTLLCKVGLIHHNQYWRAFHLCIVMMNFFVALVPHNLLLESMDVIRLSNILQILH